MATIRRAAWLFSFLLILFSVLFSLNAYAIPGTVSVKERQLDFVAEQSVEHVAVWRITPGRGRLPGGPTGSS